MMSLRAAALALGRRSNLPLSMSLRAEQSECEAGSCLTESAQCEEIASGYRPRNDMNEVNGLWQLAINIAFTS